jgi:uncharacterized protein YlbG (UPF0298 family)
MVGPFIEALMGDVGRAILYLYQDNALIINTAILIYGVFMFYCWNNLLRIYRFLIVEMAKEAHTSEELNRKKSNKKIRDIIGVPWERAIEASPFPYIARIGAVVPKKKTVENLQFYFDEKELADQVLKALQGAKIQRMMPSTRKIVQRELEERNQKKK